MYKVTGASPSMSGPFLTLLRTTTFLTLPSYRAKLFMDPSVHKKSPFSYKSSHTAFGLKAKIYCEEKLPGLPTSFSRSNSYIIQFIHLRWKAQVQFVHRVMQPLPQSILELSSPEKEASELSFLRLTVIILF